MSSPAKFGRLAATYFWMEYLSFGPYLMQCRRLRLEEMAGAQRALLYGDGDGRFLSELVHRAPYMQVTAVDASSRMLRRATLRLPPGADVRMVHADALLYAPAALPQSPFDLVVSHFFLDCFREDQLRMLMAQVHPATRAGTVWIVSDFALPQPLILRTLGAFLIRGLYLAFRLLTGLQTRRLPDHAEILREAGWQLEDQRLLLRGLLVSQRWRRTA